MRVCRSRSAVRCLTVRSLSRWAGFRSDPSTLAISDEPWKLASLAPTRRPSRRTCMCLFIRLPSFRAMQPRFPPIYHRPLAHQRILQTILACTLGGGAALAFPAPALRVCICICAACCVRPGQGRKGRLTCKHAVVDLRTRRRKSVSVVWVSGEGVIVWAVSQ